MPNQAKPLVLLADDDEFFIKILSYHLNKWGYRVEGAQDKNQLFRLMGKETPGVLLMDVRFGEHDGVEILQQLLKQQSDLPVVMLTAYGTIESAVSAIRLGAYDYITKPVDFARLQSSINHALDQRLMRQTQSLLEHPSSSSSLDRDPADRGTAGQGPWREPPITATTGSTTPTAPIQVTRPILGNSAVIQNVRRMIEGVAPTNATVLILGESGVGKELVARAIHELSPRRFGPFVPVNVAALPRELVESTLFGHEKGAFTGADRSQAGCCEFADKGTLFLDEIGEMEIGLQAKLLRFLQDRTIQRVGRSDSIRVDARIVSATNREPLEQIRKGLLREDLYYRLNVVPIRVPALRERREDIAPLAALFLTLAAKRYGKGIEGFTPSAMDALTRYDWPGNVRQLENLIERLVILSQGHKIGLAEVLPELPPPLVDSPDSILLDARWPSESARAGSNSKSTTTTTTTSSPGSAESSASATPNSNSNSNSLREIDRVERNAIIEALRKSGGNVRDAAKLLGLGQATVYRKLKQYDIDKSQY